jgi:hypothetical protein
MVDGGWWMVIFEKNWKIYPKFSQTYFLSKYFKYLIYLNIFLLKNHWKNDKTDDDHHWCLMDLLTTVSHHLMAVMLGTWGTAIHHQPSTMFKLALKKRRVFCIRQKRVGTFLSARPFFPKTDPSFFFTCKWALRPVYTKTQNLCRPTKICVVRPNFVSSD